MGDTVIQRTYMERFHLPIVGEKLNVLTDPKAAVAKTTSAAGKVVKALESGADALQTLGGVASSAGDSMIKFADVLRPVVDKTGDFCGVIGFLKAPWDIVKLLAATDDGEAVIIFLWRTNKTKLVNMLALTAQHIIGAVQFVAGKIVILTPIGAIVGIIVSISGGILAGMQISDGIDGKKLHKERITVWTHRQDWNEDRIQKHYRAREKLSVLQTTVAAAKLHAKMQEYAQIIKSEAYAADGSIKESEFDDIEKCGFDKTALDDAKARLQAFHCLSKTNRDLLIVREDGEIELVELILNAKVNALKETLKNFNDEKMKEAGATSALKKELAKAISVLENREIAKALEGDKSGEAASNSSAKIAGNDDLAGSEETFYDQLREQILEFEVVNSKHNPIPKIQSGQEPQFSSACKELGKSNELLLQTYKKAQTAFEFRCLQGEKRNTVSCGKRLDDIQTCFSRKVGFLTIECNWQEFYNKELIHGSINMAFSFVMLAASTLTLTLVFFNVVAPFVGAIAAGLFALGALLEIARTVYPMLHTVKKNDYVSTDHFRDLARSPRPVEPEGAKGGGGSSLGPDIKEIQIAEEAI